MNPGSAMNPPASSRTQTALVALGIVLVVVAAVLFIRARSGARLSIEDKVNVSSLAHRICKAAALGACPIEWVAQGQGGGLLAGRPGKPLASVEQVRTVLTPPQWSESPGPAFRNGKYAVVITPGTGAILISPEANAR